MSVICNTLSSRSTGLPALVAVLTAASAVGSHAQVLERASPEATAITPYALFQYSTLTATGNTINGSWIPVVTAAGATIYQDLTLQFNVDASGNLTITPGYPQIVTAPLAVTSSFKAGAYAGPTNLDGGRTAITVAGPGLAPGGSTEWTLAASKAAAYGTYPSSATWYVGPIVGSPLAARLKAAGITSTAWSYGVGSAVDGPAYYWGRNTLIGVSQVGNTITIVNFTDSNGNDHEEPAAQITYTLQ